VKNYFVYMLLCRDFSFYVGITNDIDRRLAEHNIGWNPKCYTHRRRPVTLAHASFFYDVEQAIAWEKQLKGWSRRKKIALVGDDWAEVCRYARGEDRGVLRLRSLRSLRSG
jgi:putative endonuclease